MTQDRIGVFLSELQRTGGSGFATGPSQMP
jgi:hypothetical protein